MSKEELSNSKNKKSVYIKSVLDYSQGVGMGMMFGAITLSYFHYSDTAKLYVPVVGISLAIVCTGVLYFYYDRKGKHGN